jgi:putative transcriptional regulator
MSAKRAASKKTVPKYSKVGRDIIDGLKLVERHVRGKAVLPVRYVDVPDFVDVRAIRERSGLTQAEFARQYGISRRSLQEWEQRRRQPEGAVRAYLLVIDRDPRAVRRALERAS